MFESVMHDVLYLFRVWMAEAVYWLESVTLSGVPLWAWLTACGVVVFLVLPTRRSTRCRASLVRHGAWKKEGRLAIRRIRKEVLVGEQAHQLLQGMTPFGFEYLITEGFQQNGSRIRKLKRVTGDGGIDGMVELNGRWHLIQAKRYAAPVSQGMVREFLELCASRRMPGLFVATSGFTAPAKRLADRNARITLLDSERLLKIIRS